MVTAESPLPILIMTLSLLLVPATQAGPMGEEHRAGIAENLAALLDGERASIPVIVQFESAPTDGDVERMLEAGFQPGMVRFTVVPALAARGPASAIEDIASDQRVTYIEHDAPQEYMLNKAKVVTHTGKTWEASWKDATGEVHQGGITGDGVGIAIVDSGIDATHPDLLWGPLAEAAGLQAKTVANYKVIGRDSVGLTAFANDVTPVVEADVLISADIPDTDNTGGHGTHVAGSAAGNGFASDGKYVGAAPGAHLIGYGAGETLVITLGLAAFDHIHKHHEELGIRIVSNSWGGAGDWNPESAVTQAIRTLANEDDLLVVFAAGNSGGDGSDIQTSVWGNIPEVLQVANYYDTTGWAASSSSRGKADLDRTWPDLAAPGKQIISTAATRGPVTYFGTGQDALITEIEGTDEPWAIPAPTPVTAEEEANGQDVVVGPYASFTGTSMATPFVSGVAALVYQANPDLSFQDVTTILRETANMPDGRTFEGEGYVIGKGVVDAAEAVAAALRTADGTPVDTAIAQAYADHSVSPLELNFEEAQHLTITSHEDGDEVTGSSVTISGGFLAGPVTDNTVPLQPPPGPPVTGDPHIYQAGLIDPFITGGHTVVPGEPVNLSVRSVSSSSVDLDVDADTATHHVLQGDELAFGPFDAEVKVDSIGGLRSEFRWDIPVDAAPGEYLFEATWRAESTGETYVTAELAFTIAGAAAPDSQAQTAPPESSLSPPVASPELAADGPWDIWTQGDEVALSEDFEDGGADWTIEQDGFAQGLLTEWSLIDANAILTWAGPQSGTQFFHAGTWATQPELSGHGYTDNADTSLLSPVIDLSNAADAEVSYWRAGCSERDFDELIVTVEPVGGTPVELERVSGDLLFGGFCGGWAENVADLTPYVGQEVQLRFRFVSDFFSLSGNLGGWGVDDVTVTFTEGAGSTIVNPILEVTEDFGLGELDTNFTFNATTTAEGITGFKLDPGDNSEAQTFTEPGHLEHSYTSPGQYVATLTVTATDDTIASTTLLIDVAPTGEVQVRIVDKPWQFAGAASTTNTDFSASVDLSGLDPGEHVLQARHFDANGHKIHDEVTVVVS